MDSHSHSGNPLGIVDIGDQRVTFCDCGALLIRGNWYVPESNLIQEMTQIEARKMRDEFHKSNLLNAN